MQQTAHREHFDLSSMGVLQASYLVEEGWLILLILLCFIFQNLGLYFLSELKKLVVSEH